MDMTELMKNTIITCIELHAGCMLLVAFLYNNMLKSFIRNGRRIELSLSIVYIGSLLTIVSDCLWTVITCLGSRNDIVGYIINLVYFIGSSAAAYGWFAFCSKELEIKHYRIKAFQFMFSIPYLIVNAFYLLSPLFGLIFSIENGEYIRGSIFYLDPLVKMGYIIAASVLAIVYGLKKGIGYLRRKDFSFALFAIPVLICGVFQTITGVDFNCLGVSFGIAFIYIVGITNKDNENTDTIFSLANSFDASYVVNMDTGRIRPLHKDRMHANDIPGMKSMDYTNHFKLVLSRILLPEDRKKTLDAFELSSISKRFEIDSSYSIRYRVMDKGGHTEMHTASFIQATGEEGKNEFLLGIKTLHSDSLLYERNEALSNENRRLEQINNSIIESVAKIVEARDGGSGAHIVRVRRITEILAGAIMNECPEYKLDNESVKIISAASVLHDVGKIAIPDAILLKPGRLTEEEFNTMKTHSAKGCDILNMFPLGLDDAFLGYALSICRWHHEKYDGRGYPDGLKGDEIPIEAQIVSAADCFDALVSERPYKKAFTPEKALEMILNDECGVFSPVIKNSLENKRSKLIELVRLYT